MAVDIVDCLLGFSTAQLLESYVTATATTQDGNSAHQLVDGDVTDRWSALVSKTTRHHDGRNINLASDNDFSSFIP